MTIHHAEKLSINNFPQHGDKIVFPNGEHFFVAKSIDGWELRTELPNWRSKVEGTWTTPDDANFLYQILNLLETRGDASTNPVPPQALAAYNRAIGMTCRLLDVRPTDTLVGNGHRYVTEWFLDRHEDLRAAYANIAELEGIAARNGVLAELRAQRAQPPTYLTRQERLYIIEWSPTSGATLKDIPEMESTIEEVIQRGEIIR